jgi:hypothetical protein
MTQSDANLPVTSVLEHVAQARLQAASFVCVGSDCCPNVQAQRSMLSNRSKSMADLTLADTAAIAGAHRI